MVVVIAYDVFPPRQRRVDVFNLKFDELRAVLSINMHGTCFVREYI